MGAIQGPSPRKDDEGSRAEKAPAVKAPPSTVTTVATYIVQSRYEAFNRVHQDIPDSHRASLASQPKLGHEMILAQSIGTSQCTQRQSHG